MGPRSPRGSLAAVVLAALVALAPATRAEEPAPGATTASPFEPVPEPPARPDEPAPPPAAATPGPELPPAPTNDTPLPPIVAPAPAPPPALPPAKPPGAAGSAPRTLRLVAALGYDRGNQRLLEVRFSDGSRQTMRLNGGAWVAAGAAFLPLQDGRFETIATIGYKTDSITGTNGSVDYTAYPLELLESLYLHPVRISAGVSLLLSPSVKGSGALSALELDMRNSLGIVGQAEWVFRFREGTGSLSVGVRALWQRLELEQGSTAEDAGAVGLLVGVSL